MKGGEVAKEPKEPKESGYRALVGLSYPDPAKKGKTKRVKEGEVVDDLPSRSVSWLLEQGAIEEVKG